MPNVASQVVVWPCRGRSGSLVGQPRRLERHPDCTSEHGQIGWRGRDGGFMICSSGGALGGCEAPVRALAVALRTVRSGGPLHRHGEHAGRVSARTQRRVRATSRRARSEDRSHSGPPRAPPAPEPARADRDSGVTRVDRTVVVSLTVLPFPLDPAPTREPCRPSRDHQRLVCEVHLGGIRFWVVLHAHPRQRARSDVNWVRDYRVRYHSRQASTTASVGFFLSGGRARSTRRFRRGVPDRRSTVQRRGLVRSRQRTRRRRREGTRT